MFICVLKLKTIVQLDYFKCRPVYVLLYVSIFT